MRIEYKYPAILHGYLHSWLFCTVKKNLFNQSTVHSTLPYPLSFSSLVRNEEKKVRWIIINLLNILVCSIAEYFSSCAVS